MGSPLGSSQRDSVLHDTNGPSSPRSQLSQSLPTTVASDRLPTERMHRACLRGVPLPMEKIKARPRTSQIKMDSRHREAATSKSPRHLQWRDPSEDALAAR